MRERESGGVQGMRAPAAEAEQTGIRDGRMIKREMEKARVDAGVTLPLPAAGETNEVELTDSKGMRRRSVTQVDVAAVAQAGPL